ncbi:MAG: CRISPR-associated endonuclease Cas2 [Planctomycetota bacterium]
MAATNLILSEYRAMWLFAMFDLPVDTKAARREYTQFRKALLKKGFSMMQYSVYARYCVSEEASESFRNHVRDVLPSDGQVRLIAITDRQFGKMDVYYGKNHESAEDPPAQLLLF